MASEIRLHIATCLRNGLDDISGSWANVIAEYYPPETVRDDLVRRSRIAIEILANILDGESSDSYSNFFRKLALEWISLDGRLDDLRNLKSEFLKICENRFLFLDDVSDSPENILKELDQVVGTEHPPKQTSKINLKESDSGMDPKEENGQVYNAPLLVQWDKDLHYDQD